MVAASIAFYELDLRSWSTKKLKYLIAKIVETEGSLVIKELDKGLLEMRNNPNEKRLSAAQMVFGQDSFSQEET